MPHININLHVFGDRLCRTGEGPMCPTSRSNYMYLEIGCVEREKGLCAPHQDQITCIWRQIV